MIHTIQLSAAAAFTSAVAGWTFSKTGGSGSESGVIPTSSTAAPADIITFDVPWVSNPVAGDTVTVDYSQAAGDYYEAGGDPVDDAMGDVVGKELVNCLGSQSNTWNVTNDSNPWLLTAGGDTWDLT